MLLGAQDLAHRVTNHNQLFYDLDGTRELSATWRRLKLSLKIELYNSFDYAAEDELLPQRSIETFVKARTKTPDKPDFAQPTR
jgi:hypothetical protein